MSAEVSRRFEVALKPRELERFTAVMAELVDSTRDESGALSYDVAQIAERYVDSAAALTHLAPSTRGSR